MPRPQKSKEEEKEKYQFIIYSKEELKQFENELEDYKLTKNIQGIDYTWYDDTKYMKDNGALNEYGAVIITGYDTKYNRLGEPYPVCDYPTKYLIIQNKFEQFYKYLGKKEFAIKQSIKNLTDTMKINDIPDLEYYNND